MTSNRWRTPPGSQGFRGLTAVAGLATMALLGALASPARAGTIGFRTDAKVTSGPGIDAEITLTHTGDEVADDVSVQAELLDRTVGGAPVDSMRPGQSEVWKLHLFDTLPRGVYSIVLRTRYADANGYPLEVVSLASSTLGVQPGPRIFGSLLVPRLTPDGEAVATLTAKRPPARDGAYEAQVVAPSGLEVEPKRVALDFDSSGKATAEFRVRNLKLLAGTSVNIFALITGAHDGFPQTDTIRGGVRITTPPPRLTSPMFYQLAGALFALLVILEAAFWISGRREAGA